MVGEISFDDCLHIATATLSKAGILVSWKFKDIVNINRIRGYNAVNYKHGHNILEIRAPREILEILKRRINKQKNLSLKSCVIFGQNKFGDKRFVLRRVNEIL